MPLARTFPLRGGPHHLSTTPTANDYYVKQLRFERHELFYVARTAYTVKAGATLKLAAKRRWPTPPSAAAAACTPSWPRWRSDRWTRSRPRCSSGPRAAWARASRRRARPAGRLVAVRRFAKKKPRLTREFRTAIEQAATRFIYQPADYADTLDDRDYASESRQIVYHTCELLAGQLFSERTFRPPGSPAPGTGARRSRRARLAAAARRLWLHRLGFARRRRGDRRGAGSADRPGRLGSGERAGLGAAGQGALWPGGKFVPRRLWLVPRPHRHRQRPQRPSGAHLGPPAAAVGAGNFNEHVLGTVSLALCRAYPARRDRPGGHRAGGRFLEPGAPVQPAASAPAASAAPARGRSRRPPIRPATSCWPRRRTTRPAAGPGRAHLAGHPRARRGGLRQPPGQHQRRRRPPAEFVGRQRRAAAGGAVGRCADGALPTAGRRLARLYPRLLPGTTAFDEYDLDGQWAFARKGAGYLALRRARTACIS